MKTTRHLHWLYSHRGAKVADRYCDMQRVIASVCMRCKKVYRLVDSQRDGGGLSHGWCSEECAMIEQRQMLERDHGPDPRVPRPTETSDSVTKTR